MGCKEHFKWINHEHVVTSPRIYGVKIYKSIQGFRGGGGLKLRVFFQVEKGAMEVLVHPGRLTWNIIMEAWKIIFLSKWVICRFYVNLPGWKLRHLGSVDHKLQLQGAVSQNHNMLIDPQQLKKQNKWDMVTETTPFQYPKKLSQKFWEDLFTFPRIFFQQKNSQIKNIRQKFHLKHRGTTPFLLPLFSGWLGKHPPPTACREGVFNC